VLFKCFQSPLLLIAVLTVWTGVTNGAPLISTNPRPQFPWEGRPVSLNVSATATAPVADQWQFDGANLARGTNRIFSMTRVNLTNDGNYQVIVADATGATTSKVAQVLVRRWPTPTGARVPELASLDTEMQAALQNRAIPGGSLAVVKDGRLVFARGYDWADVEHNEPFYPDITCRIASLAKMITTMAVMRLVEEGTLTLDTRAFPLLTLSLPRTPVQTPIPG
jgi:CubicO group peptidase (beta-lactamase class C family)